MNILKLSKSLFLSLFLSSLFLNAQVIDLGGNNLIVNSDTTLGGKYINVGTFSVASNATVTVDSTMFFLEIEAVNIFISGTVNGNAKGAAGGAGGIGGGMANGSGNSGKGGFGGSNGAGFGGGNAGTAGGNGGFITQICGGLFCSGNRDGLNAGGGGAGGGSGGAYGGQGGSGGWGAYGTGFTGASGGTFGSGGSTAAAYGNNTDFNITYGSGGAGAGGGGGGWSNGGLGGKGGKGGGMVSLYASDTIIIYASGKVLCNASNGGNGGNGAGESTNNTYTCSSSGYSSCALCSESVFDAPGGAGGGAGGGSGGGIRIYSPKVMKLFAGSQLSSNGGNGGSNGFPNSSAGTCFDNAANGGGGGGGRIKVITNCHPDNIYDMSFSVNGGIGFQSGASGTFDLMPLMPEAAGNITGDTVVCAGTSISYSIQAVNLATTYNWVLPANANIVSGAGTESIVVEFTQGSSSGPITVTPVNYCGNGTPSSIFVDVVPGPNFSLLTSPELTVCKNDSVSLEATLDISASYQWQINIACNSVWEDITGAQSNTYHIPVVSQTDCYRLIVANMCDTVSSGVIQVVAHQPTTPVITFSNNILSSNTLSGNQWYNSQGPIPGAQSQQLQNPPDEDYYVIVTDILGCVSDTSNIITVTTVGINNPLAQTIFVYPNPSTGIINFDIPDGIYVVAVTDMLGRLVIENELVSTNKQAVLNITTLTKGLYNFRIYNEAQFYVAKVILE